jgi:NAD(P)-dependent dehydrogenase (short-subunit alcohol dehydrogenase family)
MQPVLLITGGSRGIGAATALMAARRGYDVAIAYRADERAAGAVLEGVRGLGRQGIAVRADLSSEAEILRMFQAVDQFGRLAGLVNNAGITGGFSRVADLPADVLSQTLAINVFGAMICAREAVRRLSSAAGGSGGAIVNLSSLAARIGGAGEWVHYAASKAAIETFTVGLAREVAGEGIRVNAVAPGIIDTELHAAAGDPQRAQRLGPAIPLGRAGTADEVAEAILWLLSSAASYVTGTILEVGGGR